MKTRLRLCDGYLELKIGSEGPRHDPHYFIEYTVAKNGMTVCLHLGIGVTLRVNGAVPSVDIAERIIGESGGNLEDLFTKLTGHSHEQWKRFYNEYRSRCRVCGKKAFRSVPGMPGETFHQCMYCSCIAATDFDESAII